MSRAITILRNISFLLFAACVGPSPNSGNPTQKTPQPGADHLPQILVWHEEGFWSGQKNSVAFKTPNPLGWGQSVASRIEQVEIKEGMDLEALLRQYNARSFDFWLVYSKTLLNKWSQLELPVPVGRRVLAFDFDKNSKRPEIKGVQVEVVYLKTEDVDQFLAFNKQQSLVEASKVYLGPLESKLRVQSDIHGNQEQVSDSLFPVSQQFTQAFELAVGVDWSGWLRMNVLAKNAWSGESGRIAFNTGFLRIEMSPRLKEDTSEKAKKISNGLASFSLRQLEQSK